MLNEAKRIFSHDRFFAYLFSFVDSVSILYTSTFVTHSFRWICREFRERRKQNAIKNELNQLNHRAKKSRRTRTTQHTFYPCPPPTASELDNYDDDDSDDEFIDYNAVRSAWISFGHVFLPDSGCVLIACSLLVWMSIFFLNTQIFGVVVVEIWAQIFSLLFKIACILFQLIGFDCLFPLKCHNYLILITYYFYTSINWPREVARKSCELKCQY